MTWQPNSWRDHPIQQVPEYPDQTKLSTVEGKLAAMPANSLVSVEPCDGRHEKHASCTIG